MPARNLAVPLQAGRASRLFGPIIAMMLGGLALLALLVVLLVYRFDASSALREGEMVRRGFELQNKEMKAVIVPQVNWDDAVRALDHTVDPDWADFNLGDYLFTFNGFNRVFVIDAAGQPIYAASDGKRADAAAFVPFAETAGQLIAPLRAAERARPPIRPDAEGQTIVTKPIQTAGVQKIGGQVYLVLATLVQPDFGLVLPRSAQAPVAITAKPLNPSLLRAFAQRYSLSELRLLDAGAEAPGQLLLQLHDPVGQVVGKLAWTPHAMGSALFRNLLFPVLATIVLMGLLAWTIIRRGEAVVRDLVSSEERAKHLAFHDPLTHLPNRALMFERLHIALADPAIADRPVAVFCLDLDRFKEVNDTLGHSAGDLLITTTARRLAELCKSGGTVARLGGDEFVLIQRCADVETALALAETIRQTLGAPLSSEFGSIEVGTSIGLVLVSSSGTEASEVLRWADIAMYRSKELGRNRATLFEPAMDSILRKRREMENDLRSTLEAGALHMAYQPQVDRGGQVRAIEALLRWQHPVQGLISPGLFVPLAEESGLINALGEFVLRRVFAETGQLNRLRVAINVSPIQLRSPGFASRVAAIASECGVDLTRYEIEVTETALLGDDKVTAANIDGLKQLGLSIALDDFGTGYSSLSVLQTYAVDRIKIDRTFVGCLGLDSNANALVAAMVQLAATLNLGVIAEGVETEEQQLRLMACGCHEFQGHLIGEPMTAPVLSAWLDWKLDRPAQPQARRIRKRA